MNILHSRRQGLRAAPVRARLQEPRRVQLAQRDGHPHRAARGRRDGVGVRMHACMHAAVVFAPYSCAVITKGGQKYQMLSFLSTLVAVAT